MTSQLQTPQVSPVGRRALAPGLALATLAPGLALACAATTAAMLVGRFVPTVSPLLIAIVLGAIMGNVVDLPARFRPGLTFAAKRLLRVGVALLGLQLVFGDILGLGAGMIAVVIAIVGLGIVGTMAIGRLLGLS